MAYGDYGWAPSDTGGYAYNLPQQTEETEYRPETNYTGYGSRYAKGSAGAAADKAFGDDAGGDEGGFDASAIASVAGSIGQGVSHTIDRIGEVNRLVAQREALRAVYSQPGVGYKDQLQGMADVSAEINKLRGGSLSEFEARRVTNNAARRMGGRGVRGAAAQLAIGNAQEQAQDRYSQWRLDHLTRLIDQRQQLAKALQADDLRRRAALEAMRQSIAREGQLTFGTVGRWIGGIAGAGVGAATGTGDAWTKASADLWGGLAEAGSAAGPAPAYQPYDYSAYYDSIYGK